MFVTLRILCKTLVKSVAKHWHVTHIFSYLFYLHSRQVNMQVVTRTVPMQNNYWQEFLLVGISFSGVICVMSKENSVTDTLMLASQSDESAVF